MDSGLYLEYRRLGRRAGRRVGRDHREHEEFHAACKPSIKQEDAEHKSVKHVSKVEIKTFSAAVAERDSRNGRVNQKCTYNDLE
ncbi:hypothetical protein NSND_62706 [Nitrospira sp. ND1]|jgi:hypothetical protein|nr:hypothetical protein NSND_62706 [Nitrospira sp. ND1]